MRSGVLRGAWSRRGVSIGSRRGAFCGSLLLLALGAQACTSTAPPQHEAALLDGAVPLPARVGKGDELFREDNLHLTGAFDGSQRFSMWVDTMAFARRIERDYQKPLHFTYFINTCYYDHTVRGSAIGTAQSRDEEIVRWALTQQAMNEGHEIATHTVRHLDGSGWSAEQWRSEIEEFDELVAQNLFRPIRDLDTGEHVFPRFVALSNEPGEVGAECAEDTDCDSGICLPVTSERSFCSAECNSRRPCPDRMACGAPTWRTDTDVCVPMPEFPVVHRGEVLFDSEGRPNLEARALVPHRSLGFRAPQLGINAALFEVLTERGYIYDTSQIRSPSAPTTTEYRGTRYDSLLQFPLMKNPGSRTIPMDYNYYANETGGDRMRADYLQSVIDAYNERGRQPWNIGHHFALWRQGAYWEAMQDTFEFAAQGCPGDEGELRCEHVDFPSFIELTGLLGEIDGGADFAGEDPFSILEPGALQSVDEDLDCPCGEGSH